MYKSKHAVTLIETLISLTIVGIALVALLPVVTVRKASTVRDYGNEYWLDTNTFATSAQQYICPSEASQNKAVSIGAGDTSPQAGVEATNFTVYTQGLGNSNTFPLAITERLVWNDTTVKNATDNTLHIASDQSTVATGNIQYKNSLYIDNNGGNKALIIEQNTGTNQKLKQTNSNTFEFSKAFRGDATATNIIANLTTISLEDANGNLNEYLHTSVPGAYNHIGIGKNAVSDYDKKEKIISIANAKTGFHFTGFCADDEPGTEANPCLNPELVIGAKYVADKTGEVSEIDESTGATTVVTKTLPIKNAYNSTDEWVIHYHSKTINVGERSYAHQFTINAGYVSFPSINVAKVILPSDRKLKHVIAKYEKGLKALLKVKPVEFVYKNDKNKEHHIGVIAQDLRKVFPEAVEMNFATGYLLVGTDPIFYTLINSIKELNIKNKDLKLKNDELEVKIKKLRKIRDDLKASQGGAK